MAAQAEATRPTLINDRYNKEKYWKVKQKM